MSAGPPYRLSCLQAGMRPTSWLSCPILDKRQDYSVKKNRNVNCQITQVNITSQKAMWYIINIHERKIISRNQTAYHGAHDQRFSDRASLFCAGELESHRGVRVEDLDGARSVACQACLNPHYQGDVFVSAWDSPGEGSHYRFDSRLLVKTDTVTAHRFAKDGPYFERYSRVKRFIRHYFGTIVCGNQITLWRLSRLMNSKDLLPNSANPNFLLHK